MRERTHMSLVFRVCFPCGATQDVLNAGPPYVGDSDTTCWVRGHAQTVTTSSSIGRSESALTHDIRILQRCIIRAAALHAQSNDWCGSWNDCTLLYQIRVDGRVHVLVEHRVVHMSVLVIVVPARLDAQGERVAW